MVWLRLGLALLVSFLTGLLLSLLVYGRELKEGAAALNRCGCGHQHDHFPPTFAGKIDKTFQDACNEFFEMGKYLVLGAFLATTAQTFIARHVLLNIGQDSLSSIVVMMAFAFGKKHFNVAQHL